MFGFLTLLYEIHVYLLNSSDVGEYWLRIDHGVRIKVAIYLFLQLGVEQGLCAYSTLGTLP